jgi:hypothetical protein
MKQNWGKRELLYNILSENRVQMEPFIDWDAVLEFLINSVEKSPRETNSGSDSQEIPRLL